MHQAWITTTCDRSHLATTFTLPCTCLQDEQQLSETDNAWTEEQRTIQEEMT